jgi:hypothetical protein
MESRIIVVTGVLIVYDCWKFSSQHAPVLLHPIDFCNQKKMMGGILHEILKAPVLNICMAIKRAVFNMRNFMKNPTHHLLLVAEIYGV